MKSSKEFLLVVGLLSSTFTFAQVNNSGNIFFTSEVSHKLNNQTLVIATYPSEFMSYKEYTGEANEVIPKEGKVEWSKDVKKPVWVNMKGIFMRTHLFFSG